MVYRWVKPFMLIVEIMSTSDLTEIIMAMMSSELHVTKCVCIDPLEYFDRSLQKYNIKCILFKNERAGGECRDVGLTVHYITPN